MKAKALWYDGQKAIICAENLATLSNERQGTNGHVALAYELGSKEKPEDGFYHLIWEWGGDWTSFDENIFHNLLNPENLHGAFEPNYEKEYEEAQEGAEMYAGAILEAIDKAIELCPDCEEDMKWFSDLAKYDRNLYKDEWDELISVEPSVEPESRLLISEESLSLAKLENKTSRQDNQDLQLPSVIVENPQETEAAKLKPQKPHPKRKFHR